MSTITVSVELQHVIDMLHGEEKEQARSFAEDIFKENYFNFIEMGKPDDYAANMASHIAALLTELNYPN